ncbi:hypothetical protein [Xanthomonas cerealis]|uniref:hypothetical protein n=1 Tax=Xanthomonas cerealis TaxID=3390025 RepID=UPI000579335B|nr:hypothetical protein [Xanthomonas translucens]UKE46257.1 hypothetical protein KHA79_14145 [Xanthomonas translucens pv. cerealis]
MSTTASHLKKIPQPPLASTPLALLHFLAMGVSGLAIGHLGWQLLTGPWSSFKHITAGLLLSLVPVVVIAVWSLCLFGIAQHVQLN